MINNDFLTVFFKQVESYCKAFLTWVWQVQMHLCFISELSGFHHFPQKGVKQCVHLCAPAEEDWSSLPILLLCCWWVTGGVPSQGSRLTHSDNNIHIKYGRETCAVQVISIWTPYLKWYPIIFLYNILSIKTTN